MADQNSYSQEDEITLKELILKLKEYWKELWKNWWLIGIITIPILGYMVFKAIKSDVTYPAELTFMVNNDDGNSLSAFSGILGSFGLGGGGSQGEYNLDKMLQLLKSRKITENVIFTKAEIGGNEDFIGNHVINNLDTLEKWSRKPSILNRKKDPLNDFRFENAELATFKMMENAAIKRLKAKIIGSSETPGFLSSGYNEESGILNINFDTEHEELSVLLALQYYEKLSSFYTNKTIEKQQVTFDLVRAKNDSIFQELSSVEYNLANLVETSRGIFSERENLKKKRLEREIQKLTLMYGESAKNLEIADFSLKSATPFVQLIDEPLSPIKPESESLFKSIIIGGFLGVFIGFLIVIGRKIYKDTMSDS